MTIDKTASPCKYCDGQGYVAERDCGGKIQYEITCPLCGGTGKAETTDDLASDAPENS